jgi:multidrug efflux pump subunit AcrA (membrane-fusion protein)
VVVFSAIALGALLPLCPWRYKVRNECRVEPVVRRFTVVPYDGILKQAMVRPGDLVSQQQVLATMDDRELRWELSALIAERGRVAKQRDVAMAAHDTPEMQMAELEMERHDLQIKLLKQRQANLDITSPIAGVILKGDLEDAEGAPVRQGQALFEIAPLDKVKLELSVAEENLPNVAAGMHITARLDGAQSQMVTGKIDKIYPRAEIREGRNVFVAEVTLENPDNLLRPGMSGRAKVASHVRPLGWIWFHKAWQRVRNWWV